MKGLRGVNRYVYKHTILLRINHSTLIKSLTYKYFYNFLQASLNACLNKIRCILHAFLNLFLPVNNFIKQIEVLTIIVICCHVYPNCLLPDCRHQSINHLKVCLLAHSATHQNSNQELGIHIYIYYKPLITLLRFIGRERQMDKRTNDLS